MKTRRKESSRKKKSKASLHKFARSVRKKKASSKSITIHSFAGDTYVFPSGTDVLSISQHLYPNTKSYRIPKLVFVDAKQQGYEGPDLPNGVYTLIKMARTPLPLPKHI